MSSKAIEKLLALAADAERAAAAYRMAAAALNGHAVDKRVARSADVLGGALELDAARRGTKPEAKPKRKPKPGDPTRAKLAKREHTARLLAHLEEHGPLTGPELVEANGGRVGFGPLIGAGFLKRVGDKYKRTAKPFAVDWRGTP